MLAKLKERCAYNIQMENIIYQYKELRNTIRFMYKVGNVVISAYQDLICVEEHSPQQYVEHQQVRFLKHFLCADVLTLRDISLITIVDIGKIYIIAISNKVDIHEKQASISFTKRCALNVIRENSDNILLHLSFQQGHDSAIFTLYKQSKRMETTQGYQKSPGLYFPVEGCFLNIQEHKLTMYDGSINYMYSQPNTHRIQQVLRLDEYNYLAFSEYNIFMMDYYNLTFNLVYMTEKIRWAFIALDHLFLFYQTNVLKYMSLQYFSTHYYSYSGIALIKEELIHDAQRLMQDGSDPNSQQFSIQIEKRLRFYEQKYGITQFQLNDLENWFKRFLQRCKQQSTFSFSKPINYFQYRKTEATEKMLPIEDIDGVYLPFIITQNDYYKQVYRISI